MLPRYPARRGAGPIDSFVHAWNGLVHTVAHQRNMRVHAVSALLVSLVGSGIPLGLAEKVTLLFCVMLIFFAEILNSALEQLVDLATQELDEKARLTKDAAAAGVLVLAIGTVVIFAALLVHNWDTISTHVSQIKRQVLFGVPLTVAAGLLMSPPLKSVAVRLLLLGASLVLWAALLPGSYSAVFSSMTLSLLALCAASAWRLAAGGQIAGKKKPGP